VKPEIVPYDAAWPSRYEEEAARLAEVLDGVAERIDHIGSTSVPGLGAKDVIDIQVSVPSFQPDTAFREPLERLGYVYRPDPDAGHRFFYRSDESGRRLVHVHVCELGSEWERRHLAFRDRLREEPELRRDYEDLKRRLAPLFESSVDYAEAKSDFIRAAEREPKGRGRGRRRP
jgi:GrpB-like predicted nucleotidyltransferase (UPF0157 family)